MYTYICSVYVTIPRTLYVLELISAFPKVYAETALSGMFEEKPSERKSATSMEQTINKFHTLEA